MAHIIKYGNNIITKGGRIQTAPTGADNVIRDGSTVAWYDSSDLTTITKDGSDFVSRWADKLGSGRDLLQATGSKQPKWYVTDGVLFDGVDDFMKTAAFTWNQPETLYLVINQKAGFNSRYAFDGFTINKGILSTLQGQPIINIYAGSWSSPNSNLAINTFGIVRILFYGGTSKLVVNNTTPIVGNTGLNNMGGFTLGSAGNGTTYFANIQVKEVILRNVADNADDEKAIYNMLALKYGFATI
jgi:hypothetical protein